MLLSDWPAPLSSVHPRSTRSAETGTISVPSARAAPRRTLDARAHLRVASIQARGGEVETSRPARQPEYPLDFSRSVVQRKRSETCWRLSTPIDQHRPHFPTLVHRVSAPIPCPYTRNLFSPLGLHLLSLPRAPFVCHSLSLSFPCAPASRPHHVLVETLFPLIAFSQSTLCRYITTTPNCTPEPFPRSTGRALDEREVSENDERRWRRYLLARPLVPFILLANRFLTFFAPVARSFFSCRLNLGLACGAFLTRFLCTEPCCCC